MNIALRTFRMKNTLLSLIAPSRAAKKASQQFLTPRKQALKPWEEKAEAQGQRFNISPQISAIKWLPKHHSDKKLLLVHGWESRATQMFGLVAPLLALGYQVIAVDMPAHGHSGGTHSDPDKFAQSIMLTEQYLKGVDVIIGHSMGAGAATTAVARGLKCEKLVLIAGPSSIENVLRRFGAFIHLSAKATELFICFINEQVGVAADELDALKQLSPTNIPTLLIHDQDDMEVLLSESERLLPLFTQGELFVTQGLGHRKILKSGVMLTKINTFLALSLAS
jgi:pimeloyl-ACP methyl ester carboxylesterase